MNDADLVMATVRLQDQIINQVGIDNAAVAGDILDTFLRSPLADTEVRNWYIAQTAAYNCGEN